MDSKVIMPSIEDIRLYNKLIGAKYPLCGDVWSKSDGIKLLSDIPGDDIKKNQLYNGWTHNHYIKYVFCVLL